MDKDTRIPEWLKEAAKKDESKPFDDKQHRLTVDEMNKVARMSAKDLAEKLNVSEFTAEEILRYIWQVSMYVY